MPKLVLQSQTGTHHHKNLMQEYDQPNTSAIQTVPQTLESINYMFSSSAVHQQSSCQSNLMPRRKFLWRRNCQLNYNLENILLNNVNTS